MLQGFTFIGQELEILHCYCSACKCKPFVDLISCALLVYICTLALNGMDSFILIIPVNQQQRLYFR